MSTKKDIIICVAAVIVSVAFITTLIFKKNALDEVDNLETELLATDRGLSLVESFFKENIGAEQSTWDNQVRMARLALDEFPSAYAYLALSASDAYYEQLVSNGPQSEIESIATLSKKTQTVENTLNMILSRALEPVPEYFPSHVLSSLPNLEVDLFAPPVEKIYQWAMSTNKTSREAVELFDQARSKQLEFEDALRKQSF